MKSEKWCSQVTRAKSSEVRVDCVWPNRLWHIYRHLVALVATRCLPTAVIRKQMASRPKWLLKAGPKRPKAIARNSVVVTCLEYWFPPLLKRIGICLLSQYWAGIHERKLDGKEEEEAGVLVDRLDTTTTRYKMETGPDKTKVMTNNSNGFQRENKIKGQMREAVENFKYLGAIISNEGSKPEILSRIAQTTTVLSRLTIIWRGKNISLASKVKLMRTLILSTLLYACESWTLTAELGRRIQALEMRC